MVAPPPLPFATNNQNHRKGRAVKLIVATIASIKFFATTSPHREASKSSQKAPGMDAGNGNRIISGSGSRNSNTDGRSEGQSHVESQQGSSKQHSRYSIATLLDTLRSWWAYLNQLTSSSPSKPMIPDGLTLEEAAQYETLLRVVEARRADGTKPPRVVVITDLAKDYDDLAAMVVLKELHRVGCVKLMGFIANLMPAMDRARFGRGALDELDLQLIPIARGTSGFPESGFKKHKILDYEFDCDFMADQDDPRLVTQKGEDLLLRLCQDAIRSGDKLTLLLISSLEDIFTFSLKYPNELRAAVSNIILQGGYTISEGKLEPDESANNNRYDFEAAQKFHTFMQESKIPTTVYTKVAAFATPLTSQLFGEMAETKHPLGKHLRHVQTFQNLAFYRSASSKDPKERFAPFMDQEWFLRNRSSWFNVHHEPGTPYPKDEELIPYLTKVVIYDALAALGAAGSDALHDLNVLRIDDQEASIHKIVGKAGPPSDPGINPEQMALVLSALLKGSLLSCQQGIR
ncbi:hypothetical protein G7Y89_g7424 [Cudoniella acicularis]|uniref:Inosine/uridine-preferring nucleoside hydrolase domain-containing protein n=1 Tax=Cudoniella acicularis TaxID=354080 RepID=A0A8H4W234_9HELO|nr:hypothetical protein G7Y89_g7424 [Cudoniella acicularis]